MTVRSYHNLDRLIAGLPQVAGGSWALIGVRGEIRRTIQQNNKLIDECPACAVMRLEDPTFDRATYPWAYTPEQCTDEARDTINFVLAADNAPDHDPELRKRILSGLNLQEVS